MPSQKATNKPVVFDPFSEPDLKPTDDYLQPTIADLLDDADDEWDNRPDGPSLPIILFSAACGLSAGIIGLYFAYELFILTLPASAAFGTLVALAVLASVAAVGTQLLDSKAYVPNISLSCGLLVLSTLFFCVCTLSGAVIATLILSL